MANKSFSQTEALDRDGYIVIPDVLTPDDLADIGAAIDALHAKAKEDALFRTGGTLHLDGVEGDPFERAWMEPRVIAAIAHLLDADYKLSRAHVRAPLAGEGAQSLHPDYFFPPNGKHQVATMLVAIDDFNADNGSTRLVPGSQVRPQLNVPKDHDSPYPGQIVVQMLRGSVLLFSGHIWHSGTRNISGASRRSIQAVFTRPEVRLYP